MDQLYMENDKIEQSSNRSELFKFCFDIRAFIDLKRVLFIVMVFTDWCSLNDTYQIALTE